MSCKASKAQIAKPETMKYFIICGISFQIIFIIFLIFIQNFFNMTSEPIICSNLEHTVEVKIPYVSILALIELIAIIIFGMHCDVSLYFFMKQRNVQLIPWKSSQDDPAVPMKASANLFPGNQVKTPKLVNNMPSNWNTGGAI